MATLAYDFRKTGKIKAQVCVFYKCVGNFQREERQGKGEQRRTEIKSKIPLLEAKIIWLFCVGDI